MPYINEILFNVHNYFDYIVNYNFCKIENGQYIQNISLLVFEAKNDNQIHDELLHKSEDINGESYLRILFGLDNNLILYNFEAIVLDEAAE